MAGIRIDWQELEVAFESHDPSIRGFLSRTTGEIAMSSDDAPQRVEDATIWVEIEPVPSREQYRMMERFIETVVHPTLKERLQDAIVGKGAFRRFKDVLGRFPEERKRWFAFRDVLLHRHILDWLAAQKLVVAEMPAWSVELPVTPAAVVEETSQEGAATTEESPERTDKHDKQEQDELRAYLLSWARAHAEEYHYLFGPTAFERLATDMAQEFNIYRRRSTP